MASLRHMPMSWSQPPKRTDAITLERLRVFVAVAERQHVTRAAQDLDLAQSAVSAAIAALEGGLEVRLFDRVGRNIRLTQHGEVFLAEARSLLAQVERLRRSLDGGGETM